MIKLGILNMKVNSPEISRRVYQLAVLGDVARETVEGILKEHGIEGALADEGLRMRLDTAWEAGLEWRRRASELAQLDGVLQKKE